MTVRRPDTDRNSEGANSDLSDMAVRSRFITLRDAVIGLISALIGIAAGVLAYFGTHSLPEAILASIPACVGAAKCLDRWID
jgi:hypothetical protein